LTGGVGLSPQIRKMHFPTIRTVLGSLALGVLIAYTMRLPDHPKVPAPSATVAAVPAPPAAESMLIAGPSIGAETQLPVAPAQRSYRVENCFTTDTDLSAPIVRGKNAVITAALKEEWEIVRKLIDAGARVESADESGLTALMVAAQHGNIEMLRTLLERQARIDFMDFEGRTAIHYAMAAGKREALDLLLLYAPSFDPGSAAARELLSAALASGDMAVFQTILERFPPTLEWTANTRRALETALSRGMKDQVRLLLSKHLAPPTREGGTVPLIAYAIASDDAPMFKTLLACGSDPNLAIPKTAEKEFTTLIKSNTSAPCSTPAPIATGTRRAKKCCRSTSPRGRRTGNASRCSSAVDRNRSSCGWRFRSRNSTRPSSRTASPFLRQRFRPAAMASLRNRVTTSSPTRTAITGRRSTSARCRISCG
jgi:hypothetical protein